MTTKLVHLPVERIRPCPSNPRHEARDLDSLAESIASVGVLEPLLVAYDPSDREFVTVVAGSRRLAASKLAGLKKVPCILLPAMSERSELAISLVENLHRLTLSPIEKGEAFNRLASTGLTQQQVAKLTGSNSATVSICIRLANDLIPEVREAVHQGRMHINEASAYMRQPADVQRRMWTNPKVKVTSVPAHRKSVAEVCLQDAITAIRSDEDDVALTHLRRAVTILENKLRNMPRDQRRDEPVAAAS